MAPLVPSCISSTFCSHRQASWVLLATLSPFFLPFLILCVPFLLLFLAPVSVFAFSLLLLYKVQVSLRPKLKRFHRRTDKGGHNEGYQSRQQIAAAEMLDIHQQAPLEEDRGFKGLEGSNVQSAEEWHRHDKEGDEVGSCILPSRVCEFEQEKLGQLEEDHTVQDGIADDKIEEKQEEQDIIGGPSVEEGREGSTQRGFPESEVPEVSTVQNVELLASSKGQAEEGLQRPERESNITEVTREDMGKELLQKDRMEDNKQEEEEVTKESIDLKDEQKHTPLYVDATSSRTSEEYRPLADEGESFDMPYSCYHQSSVPVNWQGQESIEDRNERLKSSHVHQFEEASSKLPAIQVTGPKFQAESAVFPDQIVEKPWEELSEQFVIDTPVTHEHMREEPELYSKEDSSLEILDNKGRLDKQEDIIFPTEPFEKESEEGEQSYSLPEGHGQLRREPFIKETKDEEQSQTGRPVKNLATSFEAESFLEREKGYPSEATSSVVPLPHESHEGIEFQNRIREEQKIMGDINAIKKIVGYQGEPHASILEQISALYLFLGMEPYNWAAEVDNLERAQAEIELLKVVVGVK